MDSVEREAILATVKDSYIKGIHGNRVLDQIKKGFHPNFEMLVLDADQLLKVDIDKWLNRIKLSEQNDPNLWTKETTFTVKHLDIVNKAAFIKIEVYKGSSFFSTDYMLLYRFKKGWQIVSKIFSPDL